MDERPYSEGPLLGSGYTGHCQKVAQVGKRLVIDPDGATTLHNKEPVAGIARINNIDRALSPEEMTGVYWITGWAPAMNILESHSASRDRLVFV
jgi:hypothetical protein